MTPAESARSRTPPSGYAVTSTVGIDLARLTDGDKASRARAEASGRAGQIADGLVMIEEANARSERTEECWPIAELLRVKGELLLLQGAPAPRRWPRITSGRRSTGRAGKVPSPGKCPPPRASPGCCAIRAVPLMPWPSSSRSTTGSPRASIRPTSKRHAQIDQAQLGVDEVEVVMQAFARIRPQEGAMRVLVMPGLVGVAGFHRRDDMHQAGTVATDDKHPGDDVLLADVVLGNVFDGNASGTRQLGGALAHSIAKWFGKSRIVEDPDLPRR